ncbi:MAG: hypothetical protein Kow0069_30940 [Promethearchaeota archaeon]
MNRRYYLDVHGFDPVADRIRLNRSGSKYRYEAEFKLNSDPALASAGVRVVARVDASPRSVKNRIAFRNDRAEATVDCVHTAVLTLAAGSLPPSGEGIVELARSTEHAPVKLPAEEHFASLKSYVGGMSEVGLGNLFRLSYHGPGFGGRRQPFGFNALMQRQVVAALQSVDPVAAEAFFTGLVLELVATVPEDALNEELRAFDELRGRSWNVRKAYRRFGLFAYLLSSVFPDEELAGASVRATASWRVKKLAAIFKDTHPSGLVALADSDDAGVLSWLATHPKRDERVDRRLQAGGGVFRGEKIVTFNGVPVAVDEARALVDLERATGRVLAPVDSVESLTFGFVAKDGRVVQLGLHGGRLRTLPASVKRLRALERLNLRWNKFAEVPRVAFGFEGLRVLDVTRNRLRGLSRRVQTLRRLEVLKVGHNKLASLPPVLGRLSRLRSLHAGRNRLRELPASLGALTRLEELAVELNELASLPGELGNLRGLVKLVVDHNRLAVLPGELASLTNLRWLTASGNAFSEVPAVVSKLGGLRVLRISKNGLSRLPDDLGDLAGLRELDVSRNSLGSLPPSLGRVGSLEVLNASHNLLVDLPDELAGLKSLRVAKFGSNRFTVLPAVLSRLDSLQELDLSDNLLVDLPGRLPGWRELRLLDLSGNPVEEFPRGVLNLSRLRSLNLSGCSIQDVPPELALLSNLRDVDLSRNRLMNLPPQLAQMKSLKTFFVHPGNRLPKSDARLEAVLGLLATRGVRTKKN